jgi:hypothetical protein
MTPALMHILGLQRRWASAEFWWLVVHEHIRAARNHFGLAMDRSSECGDQLYFAMERLLMAQAARENARSQSRERATSPSTARRLRTR